VTVALLPPLLCGRPDDRMVQEALEEGPAFIRQAHPQRGGTLWHRPRSGTLSLREWDPGRIRTTWQLWCGTFSQDWKAETTDVLPEGGVVCATCDGRARGAGQLPAVDGPRTRFEPRYMRPPRICPGSGRSGLWSEHGARTGRCGVCGSVEPTRYSGGPYSGDVGLARHEPARDLLEVRCDLHGWRQLVLNPAGVAVCRCVVPAGHI
jgi:hypothetical protein